MGRSGLEIRALPQVLSSRALHLERTTLLSPPLDFASIAIRRYPLSLRRLPLQLCQFQEVQREIRVAAPGTPPHPTRNRIRFSAKELKGRTPRDCEPREARPEKEDHRGALRKRAKMVPSDPLDCSLPDRHARPEHGIRIGCDVGPLLPTADFIQPRIVALVRVRSPFR